MKVVNLLKHSQHRVKALQRLLTLSQSIVGRFLLKATVFKYKRAEKNFPHQSDFHIHRRLYTQKTAHRVVRPKSVAFGRPLAFDVHIKKIFFIYYHQSLLYAFHTLHNISHNLTNNLSITYELPPVETCLQSVRSGARHSSLLLLVILSNLSFLLSCSYKSQ